MNDPGPPPINPIRHRRNSLSPIRASASDYGRPAMPRKGRLALRRRAAESLSRPDGII
jgi:hypothetical protein